MNDEEITTQRPAFLHDRERVDILKLMDELEELVEDGAVHFFRRLWGINEDEFWTLMNKLRASLPEEVKRANRVANDSERIVTAARDEAEALVNAARQEAIRITEEARAEATRLIDSSEINKLATVQAREIVAASEASAREVRRGADEYAMQVLGGLEDHMAKLMGSCQRGKEKLDQRLRDLNQQPPKGISTIDEPPAATPPPARRESFRR